MLLYDFNIFNIVKKRDFCYNNVNMISIKTATIKFNPRQKARFKKLGVDAIYLFGSYAQGLETPISDIDIGVVFSHPEKYRNNTMDAYLDLYDIFTDIFPKIKQVDIIFLQLVPLKLQYEAAIKGKALYESSDEKRFSYQEEVIKKYADLRYFYNIRYKTILERI